MIFDEQSNGIDLAAGLGVRFGIGFALPQPQLTAIPYVPEGRRCLWFGWGGAIVINDLDRALTMAYVPNEGLHQHRTFLRNQLR